MSVVLRTPHVDEFTAAARDEGIEATFDAEQGVFLIQNLRAPQVGDVAASLGGEIFPRDFSHILAEDAPVHDLQRGEKECGADTPPASRQERSH